MKRYLKFLLLSTLTTMPIVSVVACSSSDSSNFSDRDVLNSAEGVVMANQTFKMNADLSLINIPNDGSNYNALNASVRTIISNHYSALIKSGNLSWPYETVSVNIRNVKTTYELDDTTGANKPVESETAFSAKYGADVEAKIDLTADLSFKNLTSSVPIVVIITNDTASPQTRIDAIGTYLTTYLNSRTESFEFQTLFKNNLSSDDNEAKNVYGKIATSLKDALFSSDDPIIDVEGLEFTVLPITAGQNQTIYNLTDVSEITDPDDSTATIGVINGTLQNLTLEISDKNAFSHDIALSSLTSTSLKIRQRFSDATNQISGILNQGPDALWFINSDLPNSTLPNPGDTLSTYDGDAKAFTAKVAQKLFDLISQVYPSATMGSAWTVDAITFPNANSSQFVLETDPDDPNSDGTNNGYFTINVQFSCTIGNDSILSSIGDLRLNLKTTTTTSN